MKKLLKILSRMLFLQSQLLCICSQVIIALIKKVGNCKRRRDTPSFPPGFPLLKLALSICPTDWFEKFNWMLLGWDLECVFYLSCCVCFVFVSRGSSTAASSSSASENAAWCVCYLSCCVCFVTLRTGLSSQLALAQLPNSWEKVSKNLRV